MTHCAWLLLRREEGHRRVLVVDVISNINKALPRPITSRLEQSTGGKNCTVSSFSRHTCYEVASLVVFRIPSMAATIASQAPFHPKMFFRHCTHTHIHEREQSRCRQKLPHV
ncbi:unnamed protein product, partial [Ectocarpus sp. 13 AM-2016]